MSKDCVDGIGSGEYGVRVRGPSCGFSSATDFLILGIALFT